MSNLFSAHTMRQFSLVFILTAGLVMSSGSAALNLDVVFAQEDTTFESPAPSTVGELAPTDTTASDQTVSSDETVAPDSSVLTESETIAPDPEPTPEPVVIYTPQLSTDKADYLPGETATIFGKFFSTLSNLILNIFATNEDGSVYAAPSQNVTADAVGAFTTAYTLDNIYRPLYTVIASDLLGEELARTTFTDAPASADLDQCRNGSAASPVDCTGSAWVNGNAGASNAHYTEGGSIAYRVRFENLAASTQYTVEMGYDTKHSSKHAVDYLTTVNRTGTASVVDPCDGAGVSPANCSIPTSGSLPLGVTSVSTPAPIVNATLTSLGYTGAPDVLQPSTSYTGLSSDEKRIVIAGGTIDSTTILSEGALNAAQSESTLKIVFTTGSGVSKVVIALGGHIGSRNNWGYVGAVPNSAGGISGSPYHMRIHGFCLGNVEPCTAGGNQDRSLSAGAVIVPQGTISGVKFNDVNGNGVNDAEPSIAGVTITLSGTASAVTTTASDGTYSFGSLADGTYSICETIPSGYTQTFPTTDLGSCSGSNGYLVTITGGVNTPSGGLDFGNTQKATLTLVKTVTTDSGGTASATAWTLSASGPTPISGATGDGSITSASVNAGTYNLSESDGPPGYTASDWICVGGTTVDSDTVTLAASDSATCTINNNDNVAHLIVIKHVVNDNGGTNVASDFSMTINSVTASGGSTFSGVESPGTDKTLTSVGSYSVTETGPAGYTQTSSTDCSGTIALGETKTCTITNDDIAPTLTLVKTVVTDNGGTATAADFQADIDGGNVAWSVAVSVSAGAHTASEVTLAGYTPSAWGGDCASDGSVSLALAQNKTCTVTNDDNAPSLTLVKVVDNSNGGTASESDWTLTATGPTGFSGAGPSVSNGASFDAGSYDLSESGGQPGYTASTWVCAGGTQIDGDTISLGLGQSATCTITNDDVQPKLKVVKIVENNYGGPATVSSFPLFVGATSVTSGDTNNFNAGTYTVSETNQTGYASPVFSGECNTAGSVTLAVGDADKTCTVTNHDLPAEIHGKKFEDHNGNGIKDGEDQGLAGWTINLNPGALTAVTNVNGNYSFTGLSVGTYTVTETSQAGWTQTTADPTPVILTNDQVVNDVDFGNFKLGKISGHKFDDVNGDHTLDTGEPKLSGWTVYLDLNNSGALDGGEPTDVTNGTGFYSFTGLTAGTYTVREVWQAGWTETRPNASFGGLGAQANGSYVLTVISGTNVDNRDFGNFKLATITVHKNVVAPDGQTDVSDDHSFTVELNVGSPSAIDEGQEALYGGLVPGAYTITENVDPDYTLVSITPSQVTPTSGSNTDVYVVNKQKYSHLIVIKHVVNDNGGNAVAGDFTMNVSGVNPSQTSFAGAESPGVDVTLWTGSYTADESAFTGYTKTLSEDCSGTIGVGETKTCTITNNDVAPQLKLVKVVTADNGGTEDANDWTLTATGVNDFNDLGGSNAYHDVDANVAYALSESVVPGYTMGSWSCDVGSLVNDAITLNEGESAVCTITNEDDAPSLTLVKVVTNDNGGTETESAWTLTATGPTGFSGPGPSVLNGTSFNQGTYDLSESGLAGYSASDWDCVGGTQDDGDTVTLGLGEDVTCTITNDDIQPKLTLVKTVVNDNGGNLEVSNFPLFVDTNSVTSGVANGFDAGSYTASETNQPGYSADDWGDDCAADGLVTLSVGDDKTCTITNNDLPAKLTIIKDADPNDAEDFNFSGTLGAFTLDDDEGVQDAPNPSQWQNSATFQNLSMNQTYTITEGTEPQYWVFNGVSCVNNADQSVYPATVSGQSVSVELPLGGDVTCTFVNHKTSPTRTLGFWQTHTAYTTSIFNSAPLYVGVNTPVITGSHKGILTTAGQLFGAFYSDIAKKTTKQQRSALDKARMQLLQQLVAAKLNCAAFGCQTSVQTDIANADAAYATGTAVQILASATILDGYNNSGDTIIIGFVGSATPKTSQGIADKQFWDTP